MSSEVAGFGLTALALATTAKSQTGSKPASSVLSPIAELKQFVEKPQEEGALREALLNMVQPTRAERGNVVFDVLVPKDNPAQFFVWELWQTESAAETHNRSNPEVAFRQHLLAPMSRFRARMLSQFDTSATKKHPAGSVSQLTLVPFFIAKEGKAMAIRDAQLAMVEPTWSEPGNIDYDLYESIKNPNIILFFENWNDKTALDLHMAKPYFSQYVRGQADAAVVVPWTYLALQMISPPAHHQEGQQ